MERNGKPKGLSLNGKAKICFFRERKSCLKDKWNQEKEYSKIVM